MILEIDAIYYKKIIAVFAKILMTTAALMQHQFLRCEQVLLMWSNMFFFQDNAKNLNLTRFPRYYILQTHSTASTKFIRLRL